MSKKNHEKRETNLILKVVREKWPAGEHMQPADFKKWWKRLTPDVREQFRIAFRRGELAEFLTVTDEKPKAKNEG